MNKQVVSTSVSAGLPHCSDEKIGRAIKKGQTVCRAVPPHLQVVLPMYHQSVAEHVPHDDQVRLLVVHAHPVHTQELWQQSAAVTLHYVLQRGNNSGFAWQKEEYSHGHRNSRIQ